MAAGLTVSFVPMTSTMSAREVLVDLVHLQHDVVGNLGLRQQDVHVAGQPTGHWMNCKAALLPRSRRLSVISATYGSRAGPRQPRSRVIDDLFHPPSVGRGLGDDLSVFAELRVAHGASTPKPPGMTENERFIALHMM